MLQEQCIYAVVLAGAWAAAKTQRSIRLLQQLAPDVAMVFCTADGAAQVKELADKSLLGPAVPGQLHSWMAAAMQMTLANRSAAISRQAMTDLGALTALLSAPYQYDELLDVILSIFLRVISREVPGSQGKQLTGALVLIGCDSRLTVRAATDAYACYQNLSLPEELHTQVLQIAEQRVPYTDGSQILIPLYWNDSLHGVLIVEGKSLPRQISDALQMVVNQVSIVLENTKLYELAAVDTTTRTYTRAFVLQRLHESLKSTYRTGQELSILMMDLDHFKFINDTYGHLTGDLALYQVGCRMRSVLRETDILGRYGGDEFLLVLPNTPISGAREVAMRLQREIKHFRLEVNGEEVALEISIGIGGISHADAYEEAYSLRPGHAHFSEVMKKLITQADGLMYRAKHKSTVHVAHGQALIWSNILAKTQESAILVDIPIG